MRPLLAICLAALLATTLSGCTSADDQVSPPESPAAPLEGQQFEGAPDEGTPAGTPASHGEFQREDGPVETGSEAPLQFPGAWARKTVTITNDFGGAGRGNVFVGVDSGSITILPGSDDGYRIEALLEARGATEQDARDNLDRLDLVHTDELKSDGLHLSTVTQREPAPEVIPGFTINLGGNAWADLTVYLPAGPAYKLGADASSGDVSVSDLRGPSFLLSTSSGDVDLSGLNAGTLQASTSSGDLTLAAVKAERMELGVSSGDIMGTDLRVGTLLAGSSSGRITFDGVIDTLEADASSGSIDVDAHGSRSGSYDLTASSGDISVRLLYEDGRAYRVTAETSSGDVDVDLPNSRTLDEDEGRVEVESRDFDAARLQTIVDASTSSGDVTVSA